MGPTWVAAAIALFTIFGTWPGWLSGTSRELRAEAVSGVVTDWGPPFLVWIWSYLGAENLGPLIPYLIQESAFWLGILLATFALSQRIRWWAALLPVVTYFADHLWAIHWVEKDGTVLATTTLALGVFIAALGVRQQRLLIIWTSIGVFVLGLGAIARWYMLPVLTLGALTMSIGANWLRLKSGTPSNGAKPASSALALSIAGICFLLGAGAPLAAERLLVTPTPSFHSSSIKFLDLWRAQCLTATGDVLANPSNSANRFPPELVIVDQQSICTNFEPNVWNTVKDALPGVTRVRLPANNEEVAILNEAWQDAWVSDPAVLIYARFGLATNLLGLSEYWMTLGEEEKVATGEARLTIARAPASLLSAGDTLGNVTRNGAIYVVFLPIVLISFLLARRYRPPFWVYLGLAFPLLWVINFVVIGPANDTRYISTAVGWAVLFAFLTASLTRLYRRNSTNVMKL